jgi:hypothetical protein
MAGTKPKFIVNWTKRDNQTSAVTGNTYEEMFKFFQKKNASKEEWAKFHTERPALSFKPAKGEPITEVTLSIGYTTAMPSWSKASSLGSKGKAAWDAMMNALKKHEDNHRQILEDEVKKFGALVSAETDLSLKKLSDLFKDFPDDVRKAQEAYDAKTSHGEKEGVFLPAPDKVSD